MSALCNRETANLDQVYQRPPNIYPIGPFDSILAQGQPPEKILVVRYDIV